MWLSENNGFVREEASCAFWREPMYAYFKKLYSERDLLVKKSGNLDVKKCRNINETQLYFNDFSVCSLADRPIY